LIYGFVVSLRNALYDRGWLKSASFGLPVICIGNLAVGGTGKSPMVEYLVQMLSPRFQVATLSRGYKRKTRGYALAQTGTTALEIGDEPMQFHLKFPGIAVAVGEKRLEAIPQLLHDRPGTDLVVLDDALQHRSIRAGLNILLTDYNRLYTRDRFVPVGTLRDQRKSARRAQVIVVTKCPADLHARDANNVQAEIRPIAGQQVFFTTLAYGVFSHIVNREYEVQQVGGKALLVTGIANPDPLVEYLSARLGTLETLRFPDHHIYTIDDLSRIRQAFEALAGEPRMIVTTEKDAVRFSKFKTELENLPFFVLPVEHQFLFGGEIAFEKTVNEYIEASRQRRDKYTSTQE
jgi:tetraacyldisaccharide 4'-kinase